MFPHHQVHLLDHVGFEPLREQLGKGEAGSNQTGDAVQRGLGHDAMVAMRGTQALGAMRILNQEEIRAVPADGRRDGQPSLPRILDLAIREAEKLHRADTEDPCRLALFLLADRRQALGRHGSVAGTLLSIRCNAVGDPGSCSCELRHGPSR